MRFYGFHNVPAGSNRTARSSMPRSLRNAIFSSSIIFYGNVRHRRTESNLSRVDTADIRLPIFDFSNFSIHSSNSCYFLRSQKLIYRKLLFYSLLFCSNFYLKNYLFFSFIIIPRILNRISSLTKINVAETDSSTLLSHLQLATKMPLLNYGI